MVEKTEAEAPVGAVPEDANQHCPGTEAEEAGKASACDGCPNQQICATAPKGPDPDMVAIEERMRSVKHKILVLSGKGGVGKSTFAAQLSFALAGLDKQIGLLDIDICGPSIPKMLGLEGKEIYYSNFGWSPVYVEDNLGVMSIGFMSPDPDVAVVWRGPRKTALIKQFVMDVNWGDLDYLVVDAPPGTSDEHISISQYLEASNVDGAIIVTTPQEVSLIDVRKEINFCKKVGIKVLGVVENMSELRLQLESAEYVSADAHMEEHDVTSELLAVLKLHAPHLLSSFIKTPVFYGGAGGAEKMCKQMKVPFLGRVPMDPNLGQAADEGRSCFGDLKCSASAGALRAIINRVLKVIEKGDTVSV